MKTLVIIPSRLSATRLPGKPLLKIKGLSIISHVVKKAEEANIKASHAEMLKDQNTYVSKPNPGHLNHYPNGYDRNILNNLFKNQNYIIREIGPDGNCFFNSINFIKILIF